MVNEAFAQTQCGEGTHSITQNGILTCVLDNPTVDSTPEFLGSSIQNIVSETLLPNLINMDNLGNVAEASPIIFDILVWLTSLSGIIPLVAGGVVGGLFLIKKMKRSKMQNNAKSGVLQYLCMKCDKEMEEADYLEHGGLCINHRTKKKFKLHIPKINMPKMNMPKMNMPNLKKKKDVELIEEYKPESYDEYLQQEIDSRERDLDVITDPDDYTETAKEIEELIEEKKFNSPEEALIASLEPAPTEVKDPDEMSLEELEEQIKETGHKVEVTDDKLEITQNPEVVTVDKKPELEVLKEHIEESANKMEDAFEEAIDEHDFDPSDDEIKEAQEKFESEIEANAENEQEPPNEDDINEVQRLMSEGMSQEDAIQKVISTKVIEKPKQIIAFIHKDYDKKTLEEKHEAQDIEEMSDEEDIFKLDIPKKKQSALQKKLAKTKFGAKLFSSSDRKQKEKERNKETREVLNELGSQRMLEYAQKIDDKLQAWAVEQLDHTYEQSHKTDGKKNLSPTEIEQALKKFALFASMCELMADKKTSKKRYWKRTSKYETETP